MNINAAWNWVRSSSRRRQIIALVIVSLLPVAWEWFRQSSTRDSSPPADPLSVDTLIPNGSVLVPIEVENSDSLDSILGSKGIVDLHRPAREPGGLNRVVARRVPILRAPLNPHQLAVLVPESQASNLTKESGAFWVTVQNPNRVGTKFETTGSANARPRARRRIIFDGGVE
ncbi:MAG: hypothetical protein IT288_15625 [Bdellovibrionales bacterium]|nr:hypothetical protein [Bdellovibrionales bacterium]